MWFYIITTFLSGIIVGLLYSQYRDRQLRLEREAALKESRIKSEFLANMSHEIRTPMNAIMGMVTVLLDTPLNESQRDYLHTMRNSCDSLLEVINDVLDFSKIEAGKFTIENITYSIEGIVHEAVDLFILKAKEKDLELIAEIDESVPHYLVGDPTRVRQILINLIGNAIKFTEKGSVSVTITYDASSNDEGTLMGFVKDTGIGMPKNKITRLFREYSQLDASTARRFGGSGLGLAISRKLAETMGGHMTASSIEGIGSTFVFSFKTRPATEEEQKVFHNLHEHVDYTSDAIDKGLKILIVEDNLTNQRVLQLLLKHLGLEADVTSNGKEALQIMESKTYDIIFMDMLMPVMGGVETTHVIRNKFEKEKQPFIVAITATATGADKKACIDAGMNDYMVKPFKEGALIKVLVQARRK